jgi:hypothetical protein
MVLKKNVVEKYINKMKGRRKEANGFLFRRQSPTGTNHGGIRTSGTSYGVCPQQEQFMEESEHLELVMVSAPNRNNSWRNQNIWN